MTGIQSIQNMCWAWFWFRQRGPPGPFTPAQTSGLASNAGASATGTYVYCVLGVLSSVNTSTLTEPLYLGSYRPFTFGAPLERIWPPCLAPHSRKFAIHNTHSRSRSGHFPSLPYAHGPVEQPSLIERVSLIAPDGRQMSTSVPPERISAIVQPHL